MKTFPLDLLTPTELAAADQATIAKGTPGIALMERAGAAVAGAAQRRWQGGPIIVMVGPGNNGGDGWVAARVLRDAGFRVTVAVHDSRDGITGDAALAAERFDGIVTQATPSVLAGAGLVVDALYGASVRLPLDPAAAAAVKAANRSGAKIVSVDLPSGVEGEGGNVDGDAIWADETVTFFRLKPGHVLYPGRAHCGEVTLAQIGIEDDTLVRLAPTIALNYPLAWRAALPEQRVAAHKYDRGHALVLCGPARTTGAARLAGMAALRAGAGLATLVVQQETLPIVASQITAVMMRVAQSANDLRALLDDPRFNVVVVGPGLGACEGTRETVEVVLQAGRSAVLDADALTSFAEAPERLFTAIKGSDGSVVVTPHDGEFVRLFPDIVGGSRLVRARTAAARSGATMLLKGPDTVIAEPGGRAFITTNAPPTLATAGSGDVLAGLVGGFLAQGMPPAEAAAAAAWIHGEAALSIGPGLIAEDLPAAIPNVLKELFASGG